MKVLPADTQMATERNRDMTTTQPHLEGIDGPEPPCTPEQNRAHLAEARETLADAQPRIVVRIDADKDDKYHRPDRGTCFLCGGFYGCDCGREPW